MPTKKKAPAAGKPAKVSLSGGGGQGGRSADLRGGAGPGDSKLKNPASPKKK